MNINGIHNNEMASKEKVTILMIQFVVMYNCFAYRCGNFFYS